MPSKLEQLDGSDETITSFTCYACEGEGGQSVFLTKKDALRRHVNIRHTSPGEECTVRIRWGKQ